MKKMTQNQLQLVVLLLMVIIVVVAYSFGYSTFDKMAQKVMNDNKVLNTRVAELEQKAAQKGTYEKGIADSGAEIEEIYSKYGAGITPEKSIMMVSEMEQKAQMTVSNISFSPETGIYFSTKLKEDGTSAVSLYTSQLSLNFSTSYQGLKDGMDFINSYKERMNVESFNAVYNQETGQLDATMILNLYRIVRADSEYVVPDVSGVAIGTDNIFGTYTPPVDSNK
jgi:hypothetical protein